MLSLKLNRCIVENCRVIENNVVKLLKAFVADCLELNELIRVDRVVVVMALGEEVGLDEEVAVTTPIALLVVLENVFI
jgi:hypothetical protein